LENLKHRVFRPYISIHFLQYNSPDNLLIPNGDNGFVSPFSSIGILVLLPYTADEEANKNFFTLYLLDRCSIFTSPCIFAIESLYGFLTDIEASAWAAICITISNLLLLKISSHFGSSQSKLYDLWLNSIFSVFPDDKLSIINILCPSLLNLSAIWEPINPYPPVINIFISKLLIIY